LSSVGALQATDVLVNFGLWFAPDAFWTAKDDSVLPDVQWLCTMFQQPQSYRLWWLGVTPTQGDANGTRVLVSGIPPGHKLHVPSACSLSSDQVIDRAAALGDLLEGEDSNFSQHFWDARHFTSDANHAFNSLLVRQLSEKSGPQHSSASLAWKLLFHRSS
jgi:hypothetical protein